MKRRARRVVLGAAALVAVLVAVLVLANWGLVRDHVEAWHFQLTRETETIEPRARRPTRTGPIAKEEYFFHFAADELHSSVIIDPLEVRPDVRHAGGSSRDARYEALRQFLEFSEGGIIVCLEKSGWRVLKQRFPRRAYVVILDEDRTVPILQSRRGKNRWTGPIIQYRNPDQP